MSIWHFGYDVAIVRCKDNTCLHVALLPKVGNEKHAKMLALAQAGRDDMTASILPDISMRQISI